jgi:hypothetical protein
MKQDTLIYGAMAGIAGTIAKEAIDFLSVVLGWSKYLYWHIAASIFILPEEVTQAGGLILGALGDLVAGSLFGIVLLYILKYTGKDYLYFKGLGFGWLIWLGFFGLVVNIHIIRITPTDIGTSLSAFLEHSVFGLTTAWFIGKYGQELLRRP